MTAAMNMPDGKDAADIATLEEARARIVELEKALDDAIGVILKRDAQLQKYERRLCELEPEGE